MFVLYHHYDIIIVFNHGKQNICLKIMFFKGGGGTSLLKHVLFNS